TSPARSINTVSPICNPSLSISSMLWSVDRLTVTPPTCTGSSTATGVSVPVRPTRTITSFTTVVSCRAGYLNAIAQRGDLDVNPSSFCMPIDFTFTTTPSISYGNFSRFASHDSQYFTTASIPSEHFQSSEARNLNCLSASRDSECLGNAALSPTSR